MSAAHLQSPALYQRPDQRAPAGVQEGPHPVDNNRTMGMREIEQRILTALRRQMGFHKRKLCRQRLALTNDLPATSQPFSRPNYG
jgi:hypothetical protein